MTSGTVLDLAGRWTLTDETGEYGCGWDLPGDAITALHAAGLIPEPYEGRNEYGLRWIAGRAWTARRRFTLDRTGVDLLLSGLDTVATVRVNGRIVLRAENSFRSHRADLSQVARAGENEIEITFHSNPAEAAARQAAQPFFIPWHEGNSPIPNGNMLRKVQCDFGWDWNIALAPFGLYGAMRIEDRAAPRIERVAVGQSHGETVEVTVAVTAANAEGAAVAVRLAGETVTGTVAQGRAEARFTLTDPDLWWPAGLGAQALHDLTVTVGEATAHRRIGLRRIELVTEPDAAGTGFKLRVNGHDVFARGANWIPADALAGRITRDGVRDLLTSAAAAHMNMIRVWGGGRYEPGWFYDICDELGLMVWQDFMFACNLYPSTPAFLAEVEAEVRETVARLQHHACLALWCGDNELIGALTWFPESVKDRDRYLVNYDRLNRAVEQALKETDPAAVWWPSSPSPGPLSFGDAWHEDGHGDMHFWSVWHEGRDFDHYRDVAPRFCSEFGFQSYPSMLTIRRFAGPEDFNIASPVLESHQKNKGGNARIAETMFRSFRWPERFEDFVYLSQVQQGLAIKTAVTHWRSLKPHCMGTLYWQLNDTWPVCSWSSLDHGGGWKLMHHMAQEFYAPVTVVVVPQGHRLLLKAVNDLRDPVEVAVTAQAVDMSGQARDLGTGAARVGGAAETLLDLPRDALGPQEMLGFGWTGSDGSAGDDLFAPLPYKAYDLPDAGLSLAVAARDGAFELTVTARAMAFFVVAEADVPGRFDRNALHLRPGQVARLRFAPQDPGATPRFVLRDLHSATVARS